MTKDEQDAYRSNTAALVLAAMLTNHTPKEPPPHAPEGADEERQLLHAQARQQFETKEATRRALLALEAFQYAAALTAEAEVWEGPVDEEGNPLDPRAFDPECTHGKKQSEDCAACDADAAERARANAAAGEKPATEGNSGDGG